VSRKRPLSPDLEAIAADGARLARRVADEAYFAAMLVRSGFLTPESPHRIGQMLRTFQRHGLLVSVLSVAAIRHGDRPALIDELGELTFSELDERSNALANGWRNAGLQPGQGVTILARNHRGFLDAVFAAAKCGARIVLLNTSFAGPQIREVAGREGTDLLVYDDEYAGMLEGIDPRHGRWRSWTEDSRPAPPAPPDALQTLINANSRDAPPKAGVAPRVVILTSGTTGAPKGAPRTEPRSLSLVGGVLSKVPFRAGEVTEVCVPMFHSLGFANMLLAFALGSTLVVRRRFAPEATLDSVQRNRATAIVVVPVMLQRVLGLGDDALAHRDISSLRIIFIGGAQLGAPLAKRALAAFGPIIYNLYGSTEIAYATIATPADLEAEPGCVGRVVRGSIVKILGGHGEELPPGTTGRIFVGNNSQFEGYTGGETKQEIGGLLSSGDVGHFDTHGRLFIDGRDDEMIVSGGENVFPGELEELLAGHEAIEDAAAIGVPDDQFGQRLRAFIVLRPGAALSADDVKEYVAENLARYKTPREVVFIDELPRNPTGKVLKRELRELQVGSGS
jgi:fatty-acyl-CoA synthase